MSQALSGIRVLDLSEGVAGPFAAKLMADFGADVVKVEPPGGDLARRRGPFPSTAPDPERSGLFLDLNRNKKSIVLDLQSDRDRARLHTLIRRADAVISSFTPREFDDFDLGRWAMSANSAVVVVSVTPFGLTGPYRDYEASDIVLDAFGHAMSTFGLRDREPLHGSGDLCQYYAGQIAALATLGAVMSARRCGMGQLLDVSMAETQLTSADRRSVQLVRYQYTKSPFERARLDGVVESLSGGYLPCADGWMHPEMTRKHHDTLCSLLGIPATGDETELRKAFLEWSAVRTRREISAAALERGLPIFPVNDFGDLLDDPQLAARDFWVTVTHPAAGVARYPGAPFRLSCGGYRQRLPAPLLGQHAAELLAELDQPPEPEPAAAPPAGPRASASLPLDGVRVLDLTVVWAGPGATSLLRELGAEVIRVESLQHFPVSTRGFFVRPRKEGLTDLGKYQSNYPDLDPGERPWNRFGGFNGLNRGKLSMTVDLRRPEGVEIFKRLAAKSDVVVDNYAVGVTAKLGIDYESLRRVNPGIISVGMPMFGATGPYRAVGGMGGIADAWSGLLAMRGYPDLPTSHASHTPHMDGTSGPAAAFAVLCALRHRDRTGEGQFVDFGQAETLIQQVGERFLDHQWNARTAAALGNRDRWGGIQGCYPCRDPDTWVVLTARGDDGWTRLGAAIGARAWSGDLQFAGAQLRLAHHDEIDHRIEQWSRTLSAGAATERLQRFGIPASPVLNEPLAYADTHLRERGFFVTVSHPECGTHLYPGRPWQASRWPGPAAVPAPLLGEHNEYVYKELLGTTDDEFDRLRTEQHIGEDFLC